jgi:hypothetical protein
MWPKAKFYDTNGLFSASAAGGEGLETRDLDSAGEENEYLRVFIISVGPIVQGHQTFQSCY